MAFYTPIKSVKLIRTQSSSFRKETKYIKECMDRTTFTVAGGMFATEIGRFITDPFTILKKNNVSLPPIKII